MTEAIPTRSPLPARGVITLLALAACGCAGGLDPAQGAAWPTSSTPSRWSYEVVAAAGGRELTVTATFTGETDRELSVVDGAEPFMVEVEQVVARGAVPLSPRNRSWFLKEPCRPDCVVRYHYHLFDAARATDDVALARLVASQDTGGGGGEAIEAPPSTWLLRPARARPETPFRFHVTTAPGDAFVSGVFPVTASPGTYEGKTDGVYQLAYAAVGRMRVRDVHAGHVALALLPGPADADDTIAAWVDACAGVVESYYGVYPAGRVAVLVRPTRGEGVGFGTTMGHSGAAIAIDVGARATPDELRRDWILVHEMVHTALPDLEGPQHWLEEGLATYVEPLARRKAGILTDQRIWAEWVDGMPNGLPEAGDHGLDETSTWGRTYWGGALFCLLADVEIRRRTGNAHSLGDALRGVVAAGGNISESWPIERIIEIGDKATGVPVLKELYGKMAHAPAPVDLHALWKELGVSTHGDAVTFDDAAALSAVRRGITEAAR